MQGYFRCTEDHQDKEAEFGQFTVGIYKWGANEPCPWATFCGEQQRVAIARALINCPWLVLADEPTGNLDPATGLDVFKTLRELQRSRRQTLLMVTHDLQRAALADRGIHLKQLSRVEP